MHGRTNIKFKSILFSATYSSFKKVNLQ